VRVISRSTSASLSEIGLGMEEKERENEVSDVYDSDFVVITLSRNVVTPLVHGLTFSAGPQRALTSQVGVSAFAGVARCGR
jgi:hypothetical protein